MRKNKFYSVLASLAMVLSVCAMPTKVSAATTSMPADTEGVIKLTEDIDLSSTYTVSKDLIIDLNGHNITAISSTYAINVEKGKLIVKDSTATTAPSVSSDYKTITYTSGKIRNSANSAIGVTKTGELELQSGTVESTSNIGVYIIGQRTPGATAQSPKFTMEGGYIKSQESAVGIEGKTTTFTMNGGVVSTVDNTGVSGNGSKTATKDSGGYTININGGTIIGNIKTSGYIACGIYNPNEGVVNIKGGTVVANGGVGVLARAGQTNITDGKIIATGTASGHVGDAKTIVNSAGIIFENRTKYPALTESDIINVSGKALISSDVTAVSVLNDPLTKRLLLTGGTYSSDVSNALGTSYKVFKVSNGYSVAPKTTSLSLSATKLNLEAGKTAQLEATLTPSQTLDGVTYSSSDTKVATVDATGKVTAVAEGTATITARAGAVTATCSITVKKVFIPPIIETPEVNSPVVDIPVLDTTKPVKKVEVGVKDEVSKKVVADSVNSIVDEIKAGTTVSEKTMSKSTTEAVKKALDEGKKITSKVEAKPIESNKVEKATVTKVEELVAKLEKNGNVKANVAQYLDLSVLLMADGSELGSLNELSKPIEFTIAMPKDLQKEGRKFSVIRVHDGVAEKLETVLNADGTLSFKTDVFSTYALVYEDAAQTTSQDNTVKTSDNTVLAMYGLLGLSMLGAIVLLKKKNTSK